MNIALLGKRAHCSGLGHLGNIVLNTLSEKGHTIYPTSQVSELTHTQVDAIVHCRRVQDQLQESVDFCQANHTPLVNLSTGLSFYMPENPMFPFIDTPNSAIDIVQFLLDLRRDAHKFRDWVKTIIEHHQVSKTSFSGTAVEMARILNINPNDRVVVQNWRSHKQQNLHMHGTIISVRDWEGSQEEYQIPDEYRTGYGIHRILFHHPERNITLEQGTQIFGRRAYAEGVNQILCGIEQNIDKIPFGVTNIVDFVQHGYHKWSSSGEHIS